MALFKSGKNRASARSPEDEKDIRPEGGPQHPVEHGGIERSLQKRGEPYRSKEARPGCGEVAQTVETPADVPERVDPDDDPRHREIPCVQRRKPEPFSEFGL